MVKKMNIFKIIKIIKTHWVHFKLLFFGDAEFEQSGKKYIPCYECGNVFLSRMHVNDNYDSVCRDCLQKIKDE